jgi:hypothetical protein
MLDTIKVMHCLLFFVSHSKRLLFTIPRLSFQKVTVHYSSFHSKRSLFTILPLIPKGHCSLFLVSHSKRSLFTIPRLSFQKVTVHYSSSLIPKSHCALFLVSIFWCRERQLLNQVCERQVFDPKEVTHTYICAVPGPQQLNPHVRSTSSQKQVYDGKLMS